MVNITYFNLYLKIEMTVSKIQTEVGEDKKKNLDLNVYNIPIDETLSSKEELINTYLFQCQCALFFVDVTSEESLTLVSDIIEVINFDKMPYLRGIIVQNKIDQSSAISEEKINNIIKSKKGLETLKISVKNKNGIKELLSKIDSFVNDNKVDLPLNFVYQSSSTQITMFNGKENLTFVIIGDSTVGKTCFFNRYFKNIYNDSSLFTIGVDKHCKLVKMGNEIYKITVWDTAGEERFKSLPRKYYQNAEGIFLVFDVTQEDSFKNVKNWISDVKDNSSKSISAGEDGKPPEISLYLLGNKIDKEGRVISKDEAEKMAHSLGMKYFEISCKYDVNVPEAITGMIYESIIRLNKNINPKGNKNMELRKSQYTKKKKKKGKCW